MNDADVFEPRDKGRQGEDVNHSFVLAALWKKSAAGKAAATTSRSEHETEQDIQRPRCVVVRPVRCLAAGSVPASKLNALRSSSAEITDIAMATKPKSAGPVARRITVLTKPKCL